jgi:hypothetical protein
MTFYPSGSSGSSASGPWEFIVGPTGKYPATGNGVTDDTAQFIAAINAAVTYAEANSGLGMVSVQPPPVYYAINGALVNSGSVGGAKGNAQIPLPVVAPGGNKIKLVIRGLGGDGQSWPMWTQTATPPWGGVPLVSNGVFANATAQGNSLNTYGDAVVIGGPNPVNGYGTSAALFNNMAVTIQGITINTALDSTSSPAGLGYGAVDLSGTSQAQLLDFACGSTGLYDPVWSSHSNPGLGNFSRGIIMPNPAANDMNVLRNVTVYGGYNYAVLITEHCVADALRILYCGAALCPVGNFDGSAGAVHGIKVLQCSIEGCNVEIYTVGIGSGGITYFDVDQLDWEGTTFAFYDNSSGTPTTNLTGTVRIAGYTPSALDIQGSAYTGPSQLPGLRLFYTSTIPGVQTPPSVPASTTPLINPFWHDANVYITSGGAAVTAIAVNGTATGLSLGVSGTVLVRVPTGGTVTLTYASTAPTWKWVTERP